MILLHIFLALYVLWWHYLAVMNLKRARDAGKLTRVALWFGAPILVSGAILDALCNIVIMTAILLEWPREWLVTMRLRRHKFDAGFRGNIARWLADHLLDPFDGSGKHV